MLVTLHRAFNDLAQPHTQPARGHGSRELRPPLLPPRRTSPLSTLLRVFSAVTRRLLLSDAPSTRDRRPSFVPSAVLLKGRARDVVSLADHERARAALGRSVAAVHGLYGPPKSQAAPHNGARGEHP